MQKQEKDVYLQFHNRRFENRHLGAMNRKHFFYFQRGERLAIILLLILILLVLILNVLFRIRASSEIEISQNDSLVRQFEVFHQSLQEGEPRSSEKKSVPHLSQKQIARKTYSQKVNDSQSNNCLSDGIPYTKKEKFAVGETMFLNETDTAKWKKIPGIGSVYALRIVKYKNLLGGFAHVTQLKEVYGMSEELFSKIEPYIKKDDNFKKIAVNKLKFKEVLRHPYLNYKQVKAIFDLRKRKGKIQSIKELELLDEFSAEDMERLKPYLLF